MTVLGVDVDPTKVELLNSGKAISSTSPLNVAEMVAAPNSRRPPISGRIKEVEAVIICVPTPLNKNREPDISYILETGQAIAPHLAKGTLVVLESTTYPGTTDEDLRAVLEKGPG